MRCGSDKLNEDWRETGGGGERVIRERAQTEAERFFGSRFRQNNAVDRPLVLSPDLQVVNSAYHATNCFCKTHCGLKFDSSSALCCRRRKIQNKFSDFELRIGGIKDGGVVLVFQTRYGSYIHETW